MKIEGPSVAEAHKLLQDKFRQRQQEFKQQLDMKEHQKLLQDIERLRQIRAREIIRQYVQTYSRKAILQTHYLDKR